MTAIRNVNGMLCVDYADFSYVNDKMKEYEEALRKIKLIQEQTVKDGVEFSTVWQIAYKALGGEM